MRAIPGLPKPPPDETNKTTDRQFRVLTDRQVGGGKKGDVVTMTITEGAAQVLIDTGLVEPVEDKAAPLAVKLNKEASDG